MTFDFGALPPEINSIRMYTGAGAGPMMAAAAAFGNLADELSSTASASQSALTNLAGEEWIGPSSTAMATAVEPYIAWMHTTAAQLQQAGAQAMASAAAYEAAFAMTVPPPLVAANRAQLAALVATNVLGQNTPAIAATEAQYGEMWSQDAAAMYGYAAASAAAARLSPLTSPAPATDPGGFGAQAAAVSRAAVDAPTSGLNGVVSNLPNAVQAFAAPAAAPADPPTLSTIENVLTGGVFNNILGNNLVSNVGNAGFDVVSWNVFNSIVSGILYQNTVGTAGAAAAGGLMSASVPAAPASAAAAPVLAGMGSASTVGSLSVPATWSAATPETHATPALTGSEWAAPPEEETHATWATGMPAMAAAGRSGYGTGPRYGVRPKVMPTQMLV